MYPHPFSPVHNILKFSQVFGVTSSYNSNSILSSFFELMETSKKTLVPKTAEEEEKKRLVNGTALLVMMDEANITRVMWCWCDLEFVFFIFLCTSITRSSVAMYRALHLIEQEQKFGHPVFCFVFFFSQLYGKIEGSEVQKENAFHTRLPKLATIQSIFHY